MTKQSRQGFGTSPESWQAEAAKRQHHGRAHSLQADASIVAGRTLAPGTKTVRASNRKPSWASMSAGYSL